MTRYREADLSRVRTYPLKKRSALVEAQALYRPPRDPGSFDEFWRSLPDLLAARELRELVARIARARRRGSGVLILAGAHVIKSGMGPGLIRLMEEGWVTAVALNGAGTIHDLELSFFGRTSEDVAAQLPKGRFGMARETSLWINEWTQEAHRRQEGLGEGLGRAFLERGGAGSRRSVLASAYRLGIPVTVHLSFGADINHQHPSFSGEAAGATSARDFRILCHEVGRLARGAALNLGSAVLLPEVFLKAVSVCTNLGTRFTDLTTAVLDFQKHYRPMENVVRRPNLQGGRGYYIIGHHEIMLPILVQALLLERNLSGKPGPLHRAGKPVSSSGIESSAPALVKGERGTPGRRKGPKNKA